MYACWASAPPASVCHSQYGTLMVVHPRAASSSRRRSVVPVTQARTPVGPLWSPCREHLLLARRSVQSCACACSSAKHWPFSFYTNTLPASSPTNSNRLTNGYRVTLRVSMCSADGRGSRTQRLARVGSEVVRPVGLYRHGVVREPDVHREQAVLRQRLQAVRHPQGCERRCHLEVEGGLPGAADICLPCLRLPHRPSAKITTRSVSWLHAVDTTQNC